MTIEEGGEPRRFSLQKIGTYKSRGTSNSRPIYKGPRDGLFYLGANGWKSYVRSGVVIYN